MFKLPWFEHISELHTIRNRVVKKYLRNPVVFLNGVRATLRHLDWRQFRVLVLYVLRGKEF